MLVGCGDSSNRSANNNEYYTNELSSSKLPIETDLNSDTTSDRVDTFQNNSEIPHSSSVGTVQTTDSTLDPPFSSQTEKQTDTTDVPKDTVDSTYDSPATESTTRGTGSGIELPDIEF